jgi:hypothetical protein
MCGSNSHFLLGESCYSSGSKGARVFVDNVEVTLQPLVFKSTPDRLVTIVK